MSRFAHVLLRADARLRAPEPARSRILLELAQDLDDLYRSYRARGLGESEAVRRAEAVLGTTDEAMDRLGQVHRTAYDRLFARLPPIGRHPFERALLTIVTLAALAAGMGGMLSAGFAPSASPWMWVVLAVALASVWTAGSRWIDLASRAAPREARPRARLATLLGLAVSAVLVGGLGATLELYVAFSAQVQASESSAWMPLVSGLGRAADLLAVSLALSLATLLAWFHLDRRAAWVEAARARVLEIATEGD